MKPSLLLTLPILLSSSLLFAADPDTSVNSAANHLPAGPQSAQKAADKLDKLGSTQANDAVNHDARVALAHLVNDALTPNRFSALIDALAKPARDRIGNSANIKTDDLSKAVTQLRNDFRAKYNQDFDLTPDHLKGLLVYAGQDKSALSVSLAPDLPSNKSAAASSDTSKGSAVTPIAGDPVTLALINEGAAMNAWRLNIPDQISGPQLKDNLLKHIQMIDDQKTTWPADPNTAYHAIAYHVLQSFNDTTLASEK